MSLKYPHVCESERNTLAYIWSVACSQAFLSNGKQKRENKPRVRTDTYILYIYYVSVITLDHSQVTSAGYLVNY